MQYQHICLGKFVNRPNRFVAEVELPGGTVERVHVKNTGRCRELLVPGAQVVLEDAWGEEKTGAGISGKIPGEKNLTKSGRKTRYDLVAVWKENLGWVNMDSQAPNKVVQEWLESGRSIFGKLDLVKPEYVYGKSRVDFYLEQGNRKILLEVKGCTLEINGEGYFPDAPTERGVKHVRELAAAVQAGYEGYLAFVIAMPKVRRVHPNRATHPEFAEALGEAERAGVKILYLPCRVEPDSLVCL